MGSLAIDAAPLAADVCCNKDELVVTLTYGRTLTVPLVWFPRLAKASSNQLATFELLGSGEGIHWPEIDEDVSIVGLLEGRPSVDYLA